MSTVTESKINKLLRSFPTGTIVLSSWLTENGYSLELQKRYRKSNWLESVGTGGMIRKGDHVTYEGGIYALQKQSKLYIHPGGKTALGLLGRVQYLEMSSKTIRLFGAPEEKLPSWFKNRDWGYSIKYYSSNFLPPKLGLTAIELKNFKFLVSGAARAMMECLYLVPKYQTLMECHEIMEGLNNLRPSQVQTLLEQCCSIKVKRLFLYLAEKSGHEWMNHIPLEKIDLGKGKRSVIKGGAYNSKYQITVDKELEIKL